MKCAYESKSHLAAPGVGVGVAESGEYNLDPDLSGLRRRHLHLLNHQWLIGFPGHRRCKLSITKSSEATIQFES